MRVGDLSLEEFRKFLDEAIEVKLRDIFDPDYGLELREDFIKRLEDSIASKKRVSLKDVKKKTGLI